MTFSAVALQQFNSDNAAGHLQAADKQIADCSPRMRAVQRLQSRCRRAKTEWLRAELQDAHQERGLRLAQSPDDPWGLSQADWMSAAGIGQRRRSAAGNAVAALNVSPCN